MSRFKFHILNIPIFLITLLPLRVLYIFSDIFYCLIYYVIQYRKKVVFVNLKNSFPQKSEQEITRIAKQFYKHLCDSFIETIYTINISEKEIKKRFKFINPEIFTELYQQNRNIILASGHYGNWDWTGSLSLYTKYEHTALYHPLTNKYFDELLIRVREKFGFVMVPMNDGLKDLMKRKNENRLTVSYFLTDQRPVRSSIKYWTQFLNQDTPVLLGTEKIAKKLNMVIVFMEVNKIKRGYYEAWFSKLITNPKNTKEYEITEAHTKLLEKQIIKVPQYWLWSHKRWKHKRI